MYGICHEGPAVCLQEAVKPLIIVLFTLHVIKTILYFKFYHVLCVKLVVYNLELLIKS